MVLMVLLLLILLLLLLLLVMLMLLLCASICRSRVTMHTAIKGKCRLLSADTAWTLDPDPEGGRCLCGLLRSPFRPGPGPIPGPGPVFTERDRREV